MSWDERAGAVLRWSLICVFVWMLVHAGIRSCRWPVVGDAAVMHYVNLLMDRGLRPYAEITDNNMPGAYLTERWAMLLFGRGDMGWRLYNDALLIAMAVGMVGVVGRRRWWAALLATGLFALMNSAAGWMFAVEREQVVTTLLLVGYGCVFVGVRRGWAWMWGVAGFAMGLAGTIKPTFLPLGALVFAWVARHLWRQGVSVVRFLGWGAAGMAAAGAVVLGWLVQWHAVGAWWFVLRHITPAYVGMGHAGFSLLVDHALSPGSLVLVGLGTALWWLGRGAEGRMAAWEWGAVLLGAGWGMVSYWTQGKGFLHHRYTAEVLLLLLAGVAIDGALRRQGGSGRVRAGRWVATAAVLLVCFGIVPHYVQALDAVPARDALMEGIVGDLEAVAGAHGAAAAQRLDGRVMCLDLVYGCLAALDQMGVQETAGFTGDLMLWEPMPSGPRAFYRAWFGRVMRDGQPAVLVVSNEWFGRRNSFSKVQEWPDFAQELGADYALVTQRDVPEEFGEAAPEGVPPGYRVYVRRGTLAR